jgi:sugar (pentulose or hexulose) kinase
MSGLNTRPATICRAAMEGATFGLRYGLEVIRRNGIEPQEIRLTGGGARSRLWRQMVADIFSCEVVCPHQQEAGATGAALQALWCAETKLGTGRTIEEITDRFVTLDESSRCLPRRSEVGRYDEIYQEYLNYNAALKELNS